MFICSPNGYTLGEEGRRDDRSNGDHGAHFWRVIPQRDSVLDSFVYVKKEKFRFQLVTFGIIVESGHVC